MGFYYRDSHGLVAYSVCILQGHDFESKNYLQLAHIFYPILYILFIIWNGKKRGIWKIQQWVSFIEIQMD